MERPSFTSRSTNKNELSVDSGRIRLLGQPYMRDMPICMKRVCSLVVLFHTQQVIDDTLLLVVPQYVSYVDRWSLQVESFA